MNSKFFTYTGLYWLWLAVIVLIIDCLSKYLVLENLFLWEVMPLFPHFNLCYIQNYGAAFDLFANGNGWQRWLFLSVSTSVCIVLLILMYHSKSVQKLSNIAYALIIGGAIGNLLDRVWYGFVIDMIDFYIGDWHFLTFNFADFAISIGAVLIFIKKIFSNATKRQI